MTDAGNIFEAVRGLDRQAVQRPWLTELGRFVNCDWMLGLGDKCVYLRVRNGELAIPEIGNQRLRSWSFAITAPESSWRRFWMAVPPRGFHDVFAMTSHGHAELQGDMAVFMKDLRYFKEVLALPRPPRDRS
jgi:hypothetical protein